METLSVKALLLKSQVTFRVPFLQSLVTEPNGRVPINKGRYRLNHTENVASAMDSCAWGQLY